MFDIYKPKLFAKAMTTFATIWTAIADNSRTAIRVTATASPFINDLFRTRRRRLSTTFETARS